MAAHIAFSKKKVVGQIFCFDWEEISEKISEQIERNNKKPFYYIYIYSINLSIIFLFYIDIWIIYK